MMPEGKAGRVPGPDQSDDGSLTCRCDCRPDAKAFGAPCEDGSARSIETRVGCCPAEVRRALLDVSALFTDLGVSRFDLEAIELVLAECMNNVVEHAYGRRPGHDFLLHLHLGCDSLFCRIEDGGAPMPGFSLPRGRRRNLAVEMDELPEGGFGWFLIRQLTDDLSYDHVGGVNRLSFRIAIGTES